MAKKTDSENINNTKNMSQQIPSKIDAIKELIFGENIQEYDSQFEDIKTDINSKKKELEHLIDDVKSELLQKIDSLGTDVNIRITEVEDTMNNKLEELNHKKANKKLLSELFIKLGQKIGE